MDTYLGKLQRASLKSNRELLNQLIGKIVSILLKKEEDNTRNIHHDHTDSTFDSSNMDNNERNNHIRDQFNSIIKWTNQAQQDEYLFKIQILKIIETTINSYPKTFSSSKESATTKEIFEKELEDCIVEIIKIVTFNLDENTVTGSYIADMRKYMKEWKKAFPENKILNTTEQELGEMEVRIMESRKLRVEAIKKIEEDREKHKRIREKSWRKIYSSSPPPHLILPGNSIYYQTEQEEDFDDAWERVSDFGEKDDALIKKHMEIFEACYQL